MNILLLIAVLVMSSASPHHYHYGRGDRGSGNPPWWHPNTGGGVGPGDMGHYQPGGGFGNDNTWGGGGHGQPDYGNGNSWNGPGGPVGPGGPGGPWNIWRRRTTEKPEITYPIYPIYPVTEPTDSGSSSMRPDVNQIEICKNACSLTMEPNLVCGTDNITYINIGFLECARSCGEDVQLQREGLCQSPFPNPLTPPTPTPDARIIDSVIQACIRNCPVTSEYNPVCGSNNLTYANPGRLECAQNCGLNVILRRPSACNAPVGPTDATAACISTCSVTSEYNPVCGSDNKTYPNPGRLECVQNCGLNVQLVRKSACSVPPGPNNPDLRGSTESPNGNGNGNGGGNSNGNGNGNSNGNGSGNGNGKGNGNGSNNGNGNNGNGNTNGNGNCNGKGNSNGKGNCGNNNGNSNGNGNGNNNGNGNGNTNGNGNGNTSGNGNGNCNCNGNTNGNGNGIGNGRPTMTQIMACMQRCRITPEVNAVCGTDGVTYNNPGQLLCAQFCGVDVRLQKFASCSGEIMTTNTYVCPTLPTPVEVFTNPPTTQDCINKCPASQEFRPVCGTDNVTYVNIESLQCKIQCGVAVSLLKLSACGTGASTGTPPVWENTDRPTQPTVVTKPTPLPTPSNVIQACINKCIVSQEYKPVCGTDGVTYANLQRLQCAKRCGINVDVKSLSTCYPEIDGSKNENTTDKDQFTIPADILASVFPEYTTPLTTESDESYELDERFGKPTVQVSGAF